MRHGLTYCFISLRRIWSIIRPYFLMIDWERILITPSLLSWFKSSELNSIYFLQAIIINKDVFKLLHHYSSEKRWSFILISYAKKDPSLLCKALKYLHNSCIFDYSDFFFKLIHFENCFFLSLKLYFGSFGWIIKNIFMQQ